MDLVSFLALLGQYGTVPALLVLAAVVAWLIRQLDANSKADARRHDEDKKAHIELKAELIATVRESEARSEQRMRELEDNHGDMERRICAVERDYLTRDEHYRDFSGWRAEIDKISNLIIQLIKDVASGGRKDPK